MIALVDRALSFNHSFARGWHASGCMRLWAHQPDLAIEHIEASLRISPRTRVGWGLYVIAAPHIICGRFEEALPGLLVAIQEDASPVAYQGLIACYAHLGRLAEARAALSRLRAITPVLAPPAVRLLMLMPDSARRSHRESGWQFPRRRGFTRSFKNWSASPRIAGHQEV